LCTELPNLAYAAKFQSLLASYLARHCIVSRTNSSKTPALNLYMPFAFWPFAPALPQQWSHSYISWLSPAGGCREDSPTGSAGCFPNISRSWLSASLLLPPDAVSRDRWPNVHASAPCRSFKSTRRCIRAAKDGPGDCCGSSASKIWLSS